MRNPHTRNCEAPKVLGKSERCGKPFPARSIKKTCSPDCARKLRLEWKRQDNKKKADKRPLLTCDTPGCEERFSAYKNSKFCPKHRGDYNQPHHKEIRWAAATGRYWKDQKKARAKNNAKRAATKAKDPEKWRAKKRKWYHTAVAKNPEKIRAQQHAAHLRWYYKDIKKSRAKGRANYARHADKTNARLRAEYASDLELARAKARAKQASRKERHPRRVKALSKAKEQRRRDRISRERGW
jgi:hypothetical protein